MTTQNPPGSAVTSSGESNVHKLNRGISKVQPREGWTLEGPLGHMAFKGGEDGRLERLAEVVKWLQLSCELPRSEAVAKLCDELPADAMGWLYTLQGKNKGFATPVPEACQFGYKTAQQIAKSRESDRIAAMNKALREDQAGLGYTRPFVMAHGKISTPNTRPTEPGLPSLIRYLSAFFGAVGRSREPDYEVLDDPRACPAAWLAIPVEKAHALWRLGRVVAPVAVNELEQAEPPASWKEHSPVGMLRRGPLPADRLVRLVDVVWWFIKERGTPRISALQYVCDVINADAVGWLYRVTEGTYAVPVNTTSGFIQFLPGSGTNAEKVAHNFIYQIEAAWGNAHEPNSVLDAHEQPCAALACTINQAYALWDYGTAVGSAAVVADAAPAAPAVPEEWTGEQLAARRAVFVADGERAPMMRLSRETGLKDREIRRRIEAYEKPATKAKTSGIWGGLADKKSGKKS